MGTVYKSDNQLHRFLFHCSFQFCCISSLMTNPNHPSADINKTEVETVESIHKPAPDVRGKDKAAELLASRVRLVVTAEENKRVLKKIDLVILPILLSIYFLQSLGTFPGAS